MLIRPLPMARIPTPAGYVFRSRGPLPARLAAAANPRGGSVPFAALAFALHHPTEGTILVDTGLHPDALLSLRRDFGLAMSVLFRSLKPADQPYDAQLRALDIDPAAVSRVVMTHLHVDHTSGMRLLPHAEFICTHAEWDAAQRRGAAGKGYVRRHLPPRDRMRLIDFEREGEAHGAFSRSMDLLGDGTIRLVSTPGHTAGHLSLLLSTGQGPRVLLVGDAAYTTRSIDERILPLLTDDDQAALGSLDQIRAFAAAEPEAIVVPSHDPDAWRELDEARADDRR